MRNSNVCGCCAHWAGCLWGGQAIKLHLSTSLGSFPTCKHWCWGQWCQGKGLSERQGGPRRGSVGFHGVELGFPSNEVLLPLEHVAEQPLPEVKAGKFLSTAPRPCPSVTPHSETAAPALKTRVFNGHTPKLACVTPGSNVCAHRPCMPGGFPPWCRGLWAAMLFPVHPGGNFERRVTGGC